MTAQTMAWEAAVNAGTGRPLPAFEMGIYQRLTHPKDAAGCVTSQGAFVYRQTRGALLAFFGAAIRTPADERIYLLLELEARGHSIQTDLASPAHLGAALNRAYTECQSRWPGIGRYSLPEAFFAARLSADWGTLTYTNGGHEAVLVRGDGSAERLEEGGPPLGVSRMVGYFEQEVSLRDPRETLLVMSSGFRHYLSPGAIVEFAAANRDMTGRELWSRLQNEIPTGPASIEAGDAALLMVRRASAPETGAGLWRTESSVYESRRIEDRVIRSSYSTVGVG